MGSDSRWRDYRGFTLAAGFLANLPGLVLWTSLATMRLPAWEDPLQRLGLAFPLLWVALTAIRLLRLTRPDVMGKGDGS